MPRSLRFVSIAARGAACGLLLAAPAVMAGPAHAATVPAPTAERTLVYQPGDFGTARWDLSGDGSRVVISASVTKTPGGTRPRSEISVVDTATGQRQVFRTPGSQYSPGDGGLSADGRLLAWTTATVRRTGKDTQVVDPTTHVRDLDTGKVRSFPHFDGGLYRGSGAFLAGYAGPIKRRAKRGTSYVDELSIRQPKAVGVLDLASGKLVKLPGRSTHAKPQQILAVRTDGGSVAWSQGKRCHVLTIATRKAVDLGPCGAFAGMELAADGSGVFVDSRGWFDPATGGALGAPLDLSLFDKNASRMTMDGATPADVSKVLVTCNPGDGPAGDDDWMGVRRPYLLDRATRLYTPVAGLNDSIEDGFPDSGTSFESGDTILTHDGSQIFWADGGHVWRVSAAATGPAGPLPADCDDR
ncbi:MAG: hypothetical protein PGN13_08465 [Patulibacter minatonensis]